MDKLFLIAALVIAASSSAQLKKSSGSALDVFQLVMLSQAKKEKGEIKERAETRFTLKGRVIGQSAGFIRLGYIGKDGKRITDSSALKNSEFLFIGEINEPTMAWLAGNTTSRSIDDPNATTIFLEPGFMTIVLKPGNFKNAKVSGSNAQEEYKKLNDLKESISLKWKKQLDSLRTEKDDEKNAAIRERLSPYFDEMRQADYDFFDKHPQSYVTTYLLRYYVSDLSLDSLQKYFDRLGTNLQKTNSGQMLAEEIEKLRAGSPGSMAKNFTTNDISGNRLSLADFKGKYVLLDFWASWCLPCRKGNPHLLSLYSRYKEKGFEIISISDDDSKPDAWRKAVEKDGIGAWKHVLRGFDIEQLKRTGKTGDNDISNYFGIHSLPTKILIDPRGMIIGRFGGGGETDDALDKKLTEIFQ